MNLHQQLKPAEEQKLRTSYVFSAVTSQLNNLRGTQIGGIYKCGVYGCKDHMMQDLPHALAQPRRPLPTLQALVTAGKYGRTPGILKPMDSLKVNELREELQTRGFKGTK